MEFELVLDEPGCLDRLTPDELRLRADVIVRESGRIGPQRIAFLVARPVDYALGRMASVFIDGRAGLEMEIFYDRAEALAWHAAEA